MHAYHVTGAINGIHVQFELDTGVAISLLQVDVWNKIAPVTFATLQEWNGCQLVRVEGVPLNYCGLFPSVILPWLESQ